jgi:hypothetical protein
MILDPLCNSLLIKGILLLRMLIFQVAVVSGFIVAPLISGATMKEIVSQTMNKMLHPDPAREFVWAGRLTKKFAFKSLELKNVLCG